MKHILDIANSAVYDNSITKVEYHSYTPFINSFENNDEIRISVQHQDLYLLPSSSFIYIEGSLTKADGTVSATGRLVNNVVPFLFEEIRYELNGVEIDRNRSSGYTTTIKSFVSLNEQESNSLMNAGWSGGRSIDTSSGRFNFCIPLKMLLGFAEDYTKIIIGCKHELILNRARSDMNAVVSPTDDVKIQIHKLLWKIPHITIDNEEKLSMLNILGSGRPLQIPFRSWDMYEYPVLPKAMHHTWTVKTSTQMEKPRFVILAFQTNKKNQKDKDASTFNHCNLTDLKVHLNSESYPYDDLNIRFDQNQYALLYDMFMKFQNSYYEQQHNSQTLVTWANFKTIAPLFVIDCTHQNEVIKSGPVDIRLEFKTHENIPENTTAYCLLLHDRLVEYNPLTSEVRKVT